MFRSNQFRSVLILTIVCCLLPMTAFARNSEAEQEAIAIAWVKAHNSGEVEAMAEVRTKHFQRSEVTDWKASFQGTVSQLGKLDVSGVDIPGPNTVILVVHSEAMDEKLKLIVSFHADAQDQVQEIRMEPAGESNLPPVALTGDWKKDGATVDRWLQDLAADDLFSGVVLVATSNGILYQGVAGLASREFEVPNNLATRFDVGSFNKDFTRLAIRQLESAGKLKRSDLVGDYLPDYPNKDVVEKVTLQHLLDHTSGLGDYFTEEYFQTPMGNLREISDYIPIWGTKPPLSEPGARESYSNFGYTVLGAVIEKVTGVSYPDYVVDKIFRPAGMASSGFFETDAIVPNVAVGYTRMTPEGPGDRLYKNIYLEPAKGGPWGKAYATGEDLYRFFEALLGNRLVEKENNWMGEGWGHYRTALAGGGPGLNAFLFLEGDRMVIAMANMDMPAAGQVAETLISTWNEVP